MSEVAVEYEPPAPPAPRTVEWFGETFELADKVGLMPLMRFAYLAKAGTDSDSMEGLAAMYALLEQCFTDAGWVTFQAVATRKRANQDEILGVVSKALEVLSTRPTGRPSDSSAGSPNMSASSAGVSSSPADTLVSRGRPDLALVVVQAEEFLAKQSRVSA